MRAIALIAVVACACGGGSSQPGGDSPEAPLRELLAASKRGDATAMVHALVSPDRLRKALDCPATSNVFTTLNLAIENIETAAKVLREAKGKYELRSMKLTGQTTIARGDRFRGCTASEPFEVRAYTYELRMAALGKEDRTTETGAVIQLDGRWFALLNE